MQLPFPSLCWSRAETECDKEMQTPPHWGVRPITVQAEARQWGSVPCREGRLCPKEAKEGCLQEGGLSLKPGQKDREQQLFQMGK